MLLGVNEVGDEGEDGRGVDGGVVRRNTSGRRGRQMKSLHDDLELELCSSTKMNKGSYNMKNEGTSELTLRDEDDEDARDEPLELRWREDLCTRS